MCETCHNACECREKRFVEYVDAHRAYIRVLCAEIHDIMGLVLAHGFKSKRIAEGRECREIIAKLTDELYGVQDEILKEGRYAHGG